MTLGGGMSVQGFWPRAGRKAVQRFLSARVINPLSDLKSGSIRLRELRRLRQSQWFSRQQLVAEQQHKLREIVSHAGRNSPYYKRLFAAENFDPDEFTLEEFGALPLLEKATVHSDLDDLLVSGSVKDDLVMHKTGGSTGQSLTVFFDTPWQERRAGDAMRADEWAGWRLGMQTGAVWGNPPPPSSWYDSFKRRWLYCFDLYLDTMNMSPRTMDAFASEWRRRDVDILYGHAHSLFILADYLKSNEAHGLHPKGIIATSMMLLDSERKVIEAVFGCPVTNRYGCEEVALIACECERHRGFHLNIEHLYIEFLNADGSPAAPGETAEIVVTDLYNKAMPLIRYRVGDMGSYSNRECPCGRGLPMMETVVGRTADFLKHKNGSLVAGVSLVERTLTAIPGLAQLQLVQIKMDHFDVNLVKDDAFTDASEEALARELKLVFGDDITLNLNCVTAIPREASGKYRFAKCLV